MDIYTTKGIIDHTRLVIVDVPPVIEGSGRASATEFYLDGELVRRDAWVNIFVGHLVGAKQG